MIAIKLPILPIPLAPKPIVVLLFVQVNTTPAVGLVKFTGAVAAPAHSVWLATASTVAVGFTVIVKLVDVPMQVPPGPPGVTVIVPVIGAAVALVAVKLGILPVPAAANPIAGLLFVQLYTVPVPLKVTGKVGEPLHTTWLPTPLTVDIGLTVIVNVIGVPVHVTPALV